MTPVERSKAEGEFFAEFREKMRDCSVLLQQLQDAGDDLASLGKDIKANRPLGDVGERLAALDGFASTLEDYRKTRARCQSLRDALTRYGDDAALSPVDFPNY